jgi:hypothetical protein
MSYSPWDLLLNLFKPFAWHDRGKDPSTNCHSLNWSGHEWDSLSEAREFLTKCREYDIRATKERSWILVEVQ